MRNYCTLFDSFYLTRGLAMWRSLEKHCPSYHLYIFAFDDESKKILGDLKLSNVTVISLDDFENERLLEVKPTRSKAEYCWTCTPSVIDYCINTYNLPDCTYIDADLYFFSNPNVLIEEMGSKSVLITEHRYTKKYDQSASSGIYCVQFITFKNNREGVNALTWWKDRCIEWCYAIKEDGKFGDQKYLDDWTRRFEGVHVLEHLGGGVAPWNVQQYRIEEQKEKLNVIAPEQLSELVFFHFHFLKFYKNDWVDLGNYKLSNSVLKKVYQPYLLEILDIEQMLGDKFNFGRRIQAYFYKNFILTQAHRMGRKLLGIYYLFRLKDIKNGSFN
jgi:hypothetical protein